MPSYQITEPHPSVPASNYYYAGRGGAGNITRVNPQNITSAADATGPASAIKLTAPASNAYFMSGRGGAGNLHREKERAIFSFDEELAQQQRLMEHAAPVYHIGRGGAGNEIHEGTARANSSSSTFSADSHVSRTRHSIEGAWHRVSKTFSHNN